MEEGSNSYGSLTEGSYSAGSSRDHDRSVRRRYDYPLPDDFDRISELPDSILVNILSLLPFTDVIATATLSKRWLFLWKMVSNLVFSKSDRSRTSALVSFIDKALLLHECSRINKFSVGFYYCSTYGSAVDVWLRLATRKNVEEIDLGLEPSDIMCRYTLPQHLYTSSSLVKLTLTYCSMRPIAVVSWPSLKTLSIDDDPELNDNLIESILYGCPALESLELSHCSGVTKLNITSASLKKLVMHSWSILQVSAPNVESLSILGRRYAKVVSLKLPSLLRATLSFQFLTWPHDFLDYNSVLQRLMMNLLETLNRVEELTIGNRCIQVLSLFEVKNLTAPMSMRKRLILNISSSRWNYPGIANLLRSSVSLETLVINMNRPGQNEIVLEWEDTFRKIFEFYGKLDDKYWNSQEGSLVNSLQCLKTVKIIDSFTDSFIDQMQIELLLGLLQVILKNCRVLEKVVIWTNNDADHEKSLNSMEVAQRLSSFHRASTSAVILSYNC